MSLLYDEKWYSRCRVKHFWTLIYTQSLTNNGKKQASNQKKNMVGRRRQPKSPKLLEILRQQPFWRLPGASAGRVMRCGKESKRVIEVNIHGKSFFVRVRTVCKQRMLRRPGNKCCCKLDIKFACPYRPSPYLSDKSRPLSPSSSLGLAAPGRRCVVYVCIYFWRQGAFELKSQAVVPAPHSPSPLVTAFGVMAVVRVHIIQVMVF
jgi:hypothetical protein